jgi:D-lactate dehydrogenase
VFLKERLCEETVGLASGADAVCIFVNDSGKADVVRALAAQGVRLILLRCAGFNNVDMRAAAACGVPVMRVPRYSPHAVAEHAVALLMALTRKLHKSSARVRAHDFSLQGLEGFDVYKRTVGVVGTGAIGAIAAEIFRGFGCPVLAYDPRPNMAWARRTGVQYVTTLDELWPRADIISLHVPLTPENKHLVCRETIAKMKPGVTIVNTSRGGLIDAAAAIEGLVSGKIRALGIDVYEGEAPYFFEDHSSRPIRDGTLAHLVSLPNVLMTAHQAFFTEDALMAISDTTCQNIRSFLDGKAYASPNECSGGAGAKANNTPAMNCIHAHEKKLLCAKL